MDILEALAALDAANDEQWTTDGLPKVDAVAALVGNDKLKRSDILEVSPDFTRDVAMAMAASAPAAENPGTAAKAASEDDSVKARDETDPPETEPTDQTEPEPEVEAEPKSMLDQLQDAFNEGNDELNAVCREISVLTETQREIEHKLSYLGGQLDRAKKASGADQSAIQQYLATNNRIKQEKAAARQTLIESGLAEVMKAVGPTALDAAMRQRKALPSNVRREYPRAIAL